MRPRFVLFGDSITQQSFAPHGWGASLANSYARKADVVLRGFSGYNTRWALFLLHKIFPSESLEAPPKLVTIFFGANDAALNDRAHRNQHVPLQEYKENLVKIISHIKGISKETRIVVLTPPPIDEKAFQIQSWKYYGTKQDDLGTRTNEVTGTYAKACVEVSIEAGVPVIDLWSSMQEKQGWETTYLSDGLHLSEDGNRFVFEKLQNILDDQGLSSEAMEWDSPQHSEINADDPSKTFTNIIL